MVTSVVVVAPASSENSMILLCAAFAFVFASGSLVWLIFFRRAADRPGPSLISRSIEKSKKDK